MVKFLASGVSKSSTISEASVTPVRMVKFLVSGVSKSSVSLEFRKLNNYLNHVLRFTAELAWIRR